LSGLLLTATKRLQLFWVRHKPTSDTLCHFVDFRDQGVDLLVRHVFLSISPFEVLSVVIVCTGGQLHCQTHPP
jgi:hypothetical protein